METEAGSQCASRRCRLLELPAELRFRIYQFYMEAEPNASTSRPREPALTVISRSVRAATLPIYYSSYTLTLYSLVKCDVYGQVRLSRESWFRHILSEKIKHIKRFNIRYSLFQSYHGEIVPLDFRIELSKKANTFEMGHSFDRVWFRNVNRTGDPADFEDIVVPIRNHLRTTLEYLIQSPGIGNFTVDDIDRLVAVDPETLPLSTSR
jgi:hypothetical protein